MVATKTLHKGAMFGHVSNGGGVIDLGSGYSVGFVADNEKFMTLQLFHHALNKTVKTQQWQKSKKILAKPVQKTLATMNDEIKILEVEEI